MADKTDIVLDAIKYVAEKTVENLQFDKTVICSIVTNLGDGKYQVQEGDTKYYAYSENEDYTAGTSVYVTIPQSDYNKQKLISGKVVNEVGDDYNYISPLEKFFDMTGNLYIDNADIEYCANSALVDADYPEGEAPKVLLVTEGTLQYNETRFCDIECTDMSAYTHLALSANFKTALGDAQYGNYGLHFIILAHKKNALASASDYVQTHNIYLDTVDMWGNPYNFMTYIKQSKLFEIDPEEVIDELIGYYYEKNNFTIDKNTKISYTNNDNAKPISNNLSINNIFINNINISLGYSDLDAESLILYTNDSLTYDYRLGNSIKKTLKLRWNHIIDADTNEAVAITSMDDAKKYISNTTKVHWYHYELDGSDDIAGTNWTEITDATNSFSYTLEPVETNATDSYKAIIEIVDEEGLANYLESRQEDIKDLQSQMEAQQAIIDEANAKIDELEKTDKAKGEEGASQSDIDAQLAIISTTQSTMQTIQFQINRYTISTAGYYTYIYCKTTNDENYITFTNADESATVQKEKVLIDGLEISCTNNGVYRIYDSLTNQAINTIGVQTAKLQCLSKYLNSNSTNGDITQISWYIPKNNTMIMAPAENIEYSGTDIFDNTTDANYYIITRIHPTMEVGSSETYAEKTLTSTQYYRIRKDLHQTFTNNTIKCVITRGYNNGSYEYTALRQLIFGNNSTNGTNNILIIEMGKATFIDGATDANPYAWVYNKTQSLELFYTLYNSNDEVVVSSNPARTNNPQPILAQWDFSNTAYSINDSIISVDNATFGTLVTCTVDSSVSGDYDFVGTYTAYFALPLSTAQDYYLQTGADRIIYDENGSNPIYSKDIYSLYTNDDDIKVQFIRIFNNYSLYTKEADGYEEFPYLQNTDNNWSLRPRSMYLSSSNYNVCVNLYDSTSSYDTSHLLWSQPIIITMNAWGSSILNEWDGSLVVDNDNNYILSSMVGAGKKNDDNTFTGALMGEVSSTTGTETGLFGYQRGIQSFGFKTDGTAFIGQPNKARLEFNGTKGTIQNSGYAKKETGMKLDFDGDGKNGCYIELLQNTPKYELATITADPDNTTTYPYDSQVTYYSDDQLTTVAVTNDIDADSYTTNQGWYGYGYEPNTSTTYDSTKVYYTKSTTESGEVQYNKVSVKCQSFDWKAEYYYKASGPLYYKESTIATAYEEGKTYYSNSGLDTDIQAEATGSIQADNIEKYDKGSLYYIYGTARFDTYKDFIDPAKNPQYYNRKLYNDVYCTASATYVVDNQLIEAPGYIADTVYYNADGSLATGRITHESYIGNTYYIKNGKEIIEELTQCSATDTYNETIQYYDADGNEVEITKEQFEVNPTLYYYKKSVEVDKYELTDYPNTTTAEQSVIDSATFYSLDDNGNYVIAEGIITYTNYNDEKRYYYGQKAMSIEEASKYVDPLYLNGDYYIWNVVESDKTQANFLNAVTYYNTNDLSETGDNSSKIATTSISASNFNEATRYNAVEKLQATTYNAQTSYYTDSDCTQAFAGYIISTTPDTDKNFTYSLHSANYDSTIANYYKDSTCLDTAIVTSNWQEGLEDEQYLAYYYLISKYITTEAYDAYLTYYSNSQMSTSATLKISNEDTFKKVLNKKKTLYAKIGIKVPEDAEYSSTETYYKNIYCIDSVTLSLVQCTEDDEYVAIQNYYFDKDGNQVNPTQEEYEADKTSYRYYPYRNYYIIEADTTSTQSQIKLSTSSPYFIIQDSRSYNVLEVTATETILAGWNIDQYEFYGNTRYNNSQDVDEGVIRIRMHDLDDSVTLQWPTDENYWSSAAAKRGASLTAPAYHGTTDNWRILINNMVGISWDGRVAAPMVMARFLSLDSFDNVSDTDAYLPDYIDERIESKKAFS